MLTITTGYFEKRFRKIICVFLVCILLIGIKATVLRAHDSSYTESHLNQGIPLFLNSRYVEDNKAIVKVVIWYGGTVNLPAQIPNLPIKNWAWSYKYLEAGNSKKAVTISGECILNKEEELKLYTWYTKMAPIIEGQGGKVYLDERISESLDISAYLNQIQANPVEWSLSDNLVSIAASYQKLDTSVRVGRDTINMQMLSRGQGKNGQTVLAIPVLLEEF